MSNKTRIHELSVKYEDKITVYNLNDASESAQGAFAYGTNVNNEHNNAVAFGEGTVVTADKQMVIGGYNDTENTGDCILVVGNGENNIERSNALTLNGTGDLTIAGELSLVEGVKTEQGAISTKGLIALKADEDIYIRHKVNDVLINDPIVCRSELVNQSGPYLVAGKDHGRIILKGYNLDSKKIYKIVTMMRSRYHGWHTGAWREITDKLPFGYDTELANASQQIADSKITYPDTPSWMNNGGKLASSWEFKFNNVYNCHFLEIDCSTWLVDLCKPIGFQIKDADPIICNTLLDGESNALENNHYFFTTSTPPKVAGLVGLQTTAGYRGLNFKFRLYDETTLTLLAETNEIIHVSGCVQDIKKHYPHDEDGKIMTQPSTSFVWLDNEGKIKNIFLKIM